MHHDISADHRDVQITFTLNDFIRLLFVTKLLIFNNVYLVTARAGIFLLNFHIKMFAQIDIFLLTLKMIVLSFLFPSPLEDRDALCFSS